MFTRSATPSVSAPQERQAEERRNNRTAASSRNDKLLGAMTSTPKFRRIILTGSIALIVASGAWYGAGLKIRQDAKKEVTAFTQAKPSDRIAMLEAARSTLVGKKMGLERKIEELERRRAGMGREQASGGQETR